MKKYYLIPTLLLVICWQSFAQRTDARIEDPDLFSVQMYLSGAPLTLPILELNTGANSLILEFDHYGTDIKDYIYTIQHCDSDWNPSDLSDQEYIDGFTEDRIINYTNSFNTLVDYTHYKIGLPNRNMRWTKSGNYLLKVFDDDNNKKLVLVRRFMVVEPLWFVDAQFVKTADVSKYNTHHELDFTLRTNKTNVQRPMQDVKAFVLQNGRWDNFVGPLVPKFIRANELVYDYQDEIVFPAGKEWRFFDMRSMDYRGDNVARIEELTDFYDVTIRTDETRANRPYLYRADLNGRFSIDNTNFNQTLDQCDYARVLFTLLDKHPEDGKDVYVFGELSDWKLLPEFQMQYNEEAKMYYCEPFLKQGYYNYMYVVVDNVTGKVDLDGYEGNWYETDNQYTILIYYKPFGQRYEQLVCAASLNSGARN
jgi:hypothetical protein